MMVWLATVPPLRHPTAVRTAHDKARHTATKSDGMPGTGSSNWQRRPDADQALPIISGRAANFESLLRHRVCAAAAASVASALPSSVVTAYNGRV